MVEVGKFTLESLTTGMYSDPRIVYREYIQNSVDSIENAVAEGLMSNEDFPQSLQPLQISLLPQVSQFARKWGT